MKQIPNLFTLLNLFFGSLAIIVTLQNGIIITTDSYGAQLVDLPEKIWYASLFIGLAAVVDFFDGFVARLLKASSAMGKELDSLADVVSFGVAPSMILYQFLRLGIAKEENGLNVSIIWLLPALVVASAAAYRLAKFNIDDSQQYGFKGVPTPAIGLLIASFPLILVNSGETVASLLLNKWVIYAIIALVSYLMVSNLPIMALKFKDYKLKSNMPKLILLLLAVVSAIFLKWLAIPVMFILYIILSLALPKQQA
ncbi:CDP-alcohol phosphatidyltransferase family protein [Pinibacter aurantiacus]|uniref:CDP-alcohol phosphatidyltransferase family protein n=1 Tax=Pinibacter aurantiacus TaxID=2851599 RepID=A0A9E2S5G2_9BACT|nr:CDP-alcohol phosphatidyltransferase family protein [Pinibacter aurantiacus]MBV4356993.1 CDP-alcohol phosphatidyltransferase family protein [Pinibacter aurantiacus]